MFQMYNKKKQSEKVEKSLKRKRKRKKLKRKRKKKKRRKKKKKKKKTKKNINLKSYFSIFECNEEMIKFGSVNCAFFGAESFH